MWRMLTRRFRWIEVEFEPTSGPTLAFSVRRVHIRRWHPGYWLYALGMMVDA